MEQDRMDRIDRMNMNCMTNPKKIVRTQRYGFDTKLLGVSEQIIFCCRIEQLIWTQKAKSATEGISSVYIEGILKLLEVMYLQSEIR